MFPSRVKTPSIQQGINNCEIKNQLYVPCASFKENCAQTRTLANTLINMRGKHVLVHGTDKRHVLSIVMHVCCHYVYKSQTFHTFY